MSCRSTIENDTVRLHYNVLSDCQRSVYWIHCLQKFPFTLPLKDVQIDSYTIILHLPKRMVVNHDCPMWQKMTTMRTLNHLNIFIHPKRELHNNSFHHCLHSNRVFLTDFSGFVTYDTTAPAYVRVPTSMALQPRFPGLPPFNDIRPSIGVFIQVGAYTMAFEHIMKYLRILCDTFTNKDITVVCTILDTLSEEDAAKVLESIRSIQTLSSNQVHILSVPNRGMDIGAFLRSVLYCQEHNITFDFICKLHTKSDRKWREALCDPIVGSSTRIENICRILSSIPSVGCCAGKLWTLRVSEDVHNHDIVSQYCSLLDIENPYGKEKASQHFVGGTIFWIRYSILQQLVSQYTDVLQYALRNFKSGYISNTQSTHTHSWERLMGILVTHCQMKFVTFDEKEYKQEY